MKTPGLVLALVITGMVGPAVADSDEAGKLLYRKHCEQCHGGAVLKAPELSLLSIMSPGSVLKAMESGVMQQQASAMTAGERRLLAEHLTGQKLAATGTSYYQSCTGDASKFDFRQPPDASGWGINNHNHRYFDDNITRLNATNIPSLELKWVFAFPEAIRARSQPATAGGAVYVGSQNGTVYALDQRTGCVRWTFETVAEVRTAIVVEPWSAESKAAPKLFFGDLTGNVYAVEATTGALVWRDRPDDHASLTLTAAPVLHEGTLYVPMSALEVTSAADPAYACCTFRGGVAAYDAATGTRRWTGYTIAEAPRVVGKNSVGTDRIAPSGAPVWNSPAIDARRGVLYLGTGENYSSPANGTSDAILALSLEDGSIVWQQQMTAKDAWNMGCETEARVNCPPEDGPDYDFGAATILATTSKGKDLVLAGQKSGEVFALDPDNGGKIVWRKRLGRGGIQGGVHFGMSVAGDTLYVPMSDFDGGPRWPGIARPGLYALDIETGAQQWYTPSQDRCAGRKFCQPGLSAPASTIPGAVVAGAMDGWLRAYDNSSGKVIWAYDTAVEFPLGDQGSASGGSIGGGAGPVFKDDMMFVNSGYGIYFHMPGRVLLAFGLPE